MNDVVNVVVLVIKQQARHKCQRCALLVIAGLKIVLRLLKVQLLNLILIVVAIAVVDMHAVVVDDISVVVDIVEVDMISYIVC
jgi:hypothetical protein